MTTQCFTFPFLAGLFDGDGTIRIYKSTGEYVITTHQEDLALLEQLENQFGGVIRKVANKKANRWIPNLSGIGKTLSSMEFKWKRVLIREYNSTYIWMTGAVLIVMKHFYFHKDQFDFSKNLPVFIGVLVCLLALYLFARYLKKARVIESD